MQTEGCCLDGGGPPDRAPVDAPKGTRITGSASSSTHARPIASTSRRPGDRLNIPAALRCRQARREPSRPRLAEILVALREGSSALIAAALGGTATATAPPA